MLAKKHSSSIALVTNHWLLCHFIFFSNNRSFLSLQFLYTLLVPTWARMFPSSIPADQLAASPRRYEHADQESGSRLSCNKCPAGTFVSMHCTLEAERECSPCPEGTFTRRENGVVQCHRCRPPCAATGLVDKVPCSATHDRVCACPPHSFLSEQSGSECTAHSLCPLGFGVKRRGGPTQDVLCKPCTKGTFSDVESSTIKCRAHTDCEAQGMVLLTLGTRETNSVCGPPTKNHQVPLQDVPIQVPMALSSPLLPSLSTTTHKGKREPTVSTQIWHC